MLAPLLNLGFAASADSAYAGPIWYVDSTASAGGDGSIGSPFDALSDVTPADGDTIRLVDGSTFAETLTITVDNVTVDRTGGGSKPIIDGNGLSHCIDVNAADNVTIDGIRCINADDHGIETRSGSNNPTITNCEIDEISDGAGSGVGIYVAGGDDFTITDNVISNTENDAIYIAHNHGGTGVCTGNTISTFGTSSTPADAFQKALIVSGYAACAITLSNNTITNSLSTTKGGIVVPTPATGSTLTVANNTITHSGTVGAGVTGIGLLPIDGGTAEIYGNTITGYATGISTNLSDAVDIDAIVTVYSNLFDAGASTSGTAKGIQFLEGSATGVAPGNEFNLYNNTFRDGEAGIWISNDADTLTTINNLFSGMSENNLRVQAAQTSWDSDYNQFDAEFTNQFYYLSTDYSTLADWQSNTPAGIDANSNASDPLLSPSGQPFSNSPAVGAGSVWWPGSVPDDVTGDPFDATTPNIGAFAGSVSDTATGGGRGSKRAVSKYPRRIVIGGVVYWVKSAAEERRLLLEYRAKVEAEALELAITDAPAKEVAKAKVKVVRAARRLEQVDTREADWLEYLRQEDDEIVSVILH